MTSATRSRLIIVTAGVAVLLFFLHLLGLLAGSEASVMRVLAVPESRLAMAARSLRELSAAPFRLSAILEENQALKKERDALLMQTADIQKAQEENISLRALLTFAKPRKKPLIAAQVLAAEPDPDTHAILIDKGLRDGVGLDEPVVAEAGIIIGKIFKVDQTTSMVLLLTDTRSRVGATAGSGASTQGIVQGKNGLSLEMGLIPQNQGIAPGDLVVTSGIEPLVPDGLVIGRVSEVQAPERDPFKTATIESPVDYSRVDVVGIIAP